MNYIDALLMVSGKALVKGVAATVSTKGSSQKDKVKAVKKGSTSNQTSQSLEKELTDEDAYDQIDQKPQASIIKWMMDQGEIDLAVLAKFLGYKTQSLRNKFSRDSFSIDDFVITAYACDFDLVLKKKGSDASTDRLINPETYLSKDGGRTWNRISELKRKNYAEKRAEYEDLKARLAELEKEYQFETDK